MRVALFSEVFLPKIDGITNRLRNTVECLRADGHEVLVFAPENAAPEHAGARVVRLPGLLFPPYPELRATLPDPRIAWELARFAPDVVHAVGSACLGVWASWPPARCACRSWPRTTPTCPATCRCTTSAGPGRSPGR